MEGYVAQIWAPEMAGVMEPLRLQWFRSRSVQFRASGKAGVLPVKHRFVSHL